MKSEQERIAHGRFVKVLQHEHITCLKPGCGGARDVADHTPHNAHIKSYEATSERCPVKEKNTGIEKTTPPRDVAPFTIKTGLHLPHEQPVSPLDDTPITFPSMPNPRRKARYRLSCFYCGRHAEMNWPPPEAKR